MVPANLAVIAVANEVPDGMNGSHYSVFAEVLNPENAGKGLVLGYGTTETEAMEACDEKVEELKNLSFPMLTIVEYHN